MKRPVFQVSNETSTEQTKRLKGVRRQELVDRLAMTIERVKERHKELPIAFLVQTRPFSTNKMSGARKTFETKEYLEYRELIAVKAGGHYGFTGKEKMNLHVIAGFSNKRGDSDNTLKPLLDSIVGSVDDAFDDSQVYHLDVTKQIVPKGQEFMLVVLEVLEEPEYTRVLEEAYTKMPKGLF